MTSVGGWSLGPRRGQKPGGPSPTLMAACSPRGPTCRSFGDVLTRLTETFVFGDDEVEYLVGEGEAASARVGPRAQSRIRSLAE